MFNVTTILLFAAACSSAGTIAYEWSISAENVQFDAFDSWDVIRIEGGLPVFGNGYPNLPAVSRCYVIPQGTTVTSIEVTDISTVSLGRALLPVPVMLMSLRTILKCVLRTCQALSQ
jgi:hypothetical protein